jgi:tripeptide aminopeptidase
VDISADLTNKVLEMAVSLQQIPAPTFFEADRGQAVADQFRQNSLLDVSIDERGNVYGRIPGNQGKHPVVVSAHLDTVFAPDTPLAVQRNADKISGPGIGDNSAGLAGLFGLLWALQDQDVRLPGDVWLVANTGEEGLGNLRGMQAVVERFGDQPHAYVVLEGLALGQVYHRALASLRYRIRLETQGGHSWVDYGRTSAVHELARLVNVLVAVQLPAEPRTTLNVGTIHGGLSVNTIASDAELTLDLRSEDPETLESLAQHVRQICQRVPAQNTKVHLEIIGQRPGGMLDRQHPLVKLATRSLQDLGLHPRLNIGSTDANVPLSQGLPAVCIGVTTGSGAHTLGEYINVPPLKQGLAQIVALVQGIFQLD